MTSTKIGYARFSTDSQDLTAQKLALEALGVVRDRVCTDLGLTGTNRTRPGLDQAIAAVREGDLIRMRTRDGMAITRAMGKLRGKQPKLSDKQQHKLIRMHATGEYSISDPAEAFCVSRPIVYRTLQRAKVKGASA